MRRDHEHGNVIAKGQILSDVITLTRSWVTEHELVFSDPEDNSKMWKTTYSKLKDICSEVKFEDQDLFARNPTTLVVGGIAHSLTFLLDKQKSLVYISIYD